MQYKVELKWGIILAVGLFLYEYVLKMLGYHTEKIESHAMISMAGYVIPVICLFMGMREKRETDLTGNMTYWQAMVAGIMIFVMSIPLQAFLTYLLVDYLSPDYFTNAITAGVERGLEEERLSAYFNTRSYVIQTVLGGFSFGVIISLILAIFLKKNQQST